MKIGDKIPEMLGVDANGKEVKASDYAGKRLAIYFYPKDNTPGCTAEACSLRDGYDALRSAGYEVIGVSKEFNAFELRNAIVNRDVFKANQIINYFDSNPKSGSLFALLPMLFSYFQNLMLAYYAPNKQDEKALSLFLDLKSTWAVRDYITGMRNYNGVKVMQIIDKFREVDAKSKGISNPNTSAGELMKELIFFILH